MWIVRGPFDGDEGQDSSPEKSKLLKTGKLYTLGRKNADLLIRSKKISKEHVAFDVSEFPESLVGDPTFKPKVRLRNPRNKPITVQRGSDLITLDPSSSTELCDGDAIHLVGGITALISWYPLCCRSPATFAVDKGSCAKIGIHVVHSSYPETTHHVVQELTLTPSCVLLLFNSKAVNIEWLTEVIRRGTEGGPTSILEQHFELPDASHFPAVSATLPSTSSRMDLSMNDIDRCRVLDGYRLIVFTRDSETTEDFQSVISMSGGGYELFAVDSGKARFHRRLSVNKDKRKKMIVVDNEVRASVTPGSWNELIDEAKAFELTFCSREQVLEAVMVGEPSILGHYSTPQVLGVSSPPDQEVLLQGHVEGSQRSKRLTRRTTPSAHSPFDRELSSEVEPQQVRRVLTRRVKGGSVPPTVGDSGTLDGSHCIGNDSVPSIGIDMKMPLLPRPTRPLKRRAGTAVPESVLQPMGELGTSSVEPPLKKFKALFEESNPDHIASSLPRESPDVVQDSTHPWSMPSDGSPDHEGHPLIVEGNQASQPHAVVGGRGTKRRASAEDGGNGPLSPTSVQQDLARPLKRRVVERTPGSTTETNSQHSQNRGGAKLGEPDTDKHFLTALASVKKGKKTEDSFDREFNNLRISKPDIEREVVEQEWDLLDGFDEHNVRGNFMLVVELDVHEKGASAGMGTLRTGRIDWEGKPNFKKFRKKSDNARRPAVELVMNQGNDYGVGSAYWKDDPDAHQIDEFLGHSQASSKVQTLQLSVEDSDGEDLFPAKPPGKTSTRTVKGKNQGSGKGIPEPLFLSSEDEEVVGATKHGEDDDQDEGTETLRSVGSSRKPRVRQGQKQRAVVPIDDDDSDDGTTFRGFGAGLRSNRT